MKVKQTINFPIDARRREAISALSEHTASVYVLGYSTLGPCSYRLYWQFLKQHGLGHYPFPVIRGGKTEDVEAWLGPSDSEPAA